MSRTVIWTLVAVVVLGLATLVAYTAARSGWGLTAPLDAPVQLPADHPAAKPPS